MSELEKSALEADQALGELLSVVQELERRGRAAARLARRPVAYIAGGALLVLLSAGLVRLIRGPSDRHRRRMRQARLTALERAWRHPRWVAPKSEHRPYSLQLLQGVVTTAAGAWARSLVNQRA